jgi:hypothetical protein
VGKLKSGQGDCRQGEMVKLKRRSRTLDTDLTDSEGEYRLKIVGGGDWCGVGQPPCSPPGF